MIRGLRRQALDLPLAATPTSRFMTWATAGLTYLAVLAFALAALSDGRMASLAGQARMLGITLPPTAEAASGAAETGRLLERLRALPGVAFAEAVPETEVADLVNPWIARAAGESTALPRLIDVAYNPGVTPDLAAVRALAPDAVVEETAAAGRGDGGTARLLRLAGGAAGLLLLLGGVVLVVVVTRLSLDLHDQTVDLLRLMGAPDPYVARQFEQHTLSRGLRGSVIGFALAMLTLLLLAWLLGAVGEAGLRPVDWVLLTCVPVVAVLLASLAARLTALHGLARLR